MRHPPRGAFVTLVITVLMLLTLLAVRVWLDEVLRRHGVVWLLIPVVIVTLGVAIWSAGRRRRAGQDGGRLPRADGEPPPGA